MRPVCRFGDIFEVKLDDGRKRFFQFVCRDLEQLNSDVIRVFEHTYQKEDHPDIETIISDKKEYYVHTSVYAGAKFGFWGKYGKSSNVGTMDGYYRVPRDFGFKADEPHVVKKSYQWYVWKINEDSKRVGSLPKRYRGAYHGFVDPPYWVAEAIKGLHQYEPYYYPY